MATVVDTVLTCRGKSRSPFPLSTSKRFIIYRFHLALEGFETSQGFEMHVT